ncbi:bifunctional adenosylcobinamide kinase/adenosylcobinamide-phosphate guanylyltransferase [Pseudalkalibacillus salsuginis]|uniref:bifunctional adenosylcobinamide kinase/adenosylcobinamide-phosphate guanylyltransferase n=1 Tax=Pseudalkalibacillus salsuginis TaxID=2910972 RepID=UPI001F1F34B9|nr:bifunctional adenosylcobinamide kinase/adenosylcobinamide-phosphate guanylyltransferase [Pseudalkalibacillus salsuginis]MCF6411676.1 bifunctional adenosylcobinamide kinase/adenosylcobinamide-phosphate guanylyltransferase [Pseudalkalibacillus salsuginis]
MHFITGGAFNGKKSWVKKHYQIEGHSHYQWVSAYQQDPLPFDLSTFGKQLLFLEGIEQWIKGLLLEMDMDESRRSWHERLVKWQRWEDKNRLNRIILIGTDISKGIVPLEKTERTWRDVTGWCYQDSAEKAERVDLVWYGINQRIK